MRFFSLILALTLLAASSSPIAFQEKAEDNLEEVCALMITQEQSHSLKSRAVLKIADVHLPIDRRCDINPLFRVVIQHGPSLPRYLKHCTLLI